MEATMTLDQACTELERQSKEKRDMVGDTRAMTVRLDDDRKGFPATMELEGVAGAFDVNEHCEQQVARWCGIHLDYVKRMKAEAPRLYEQNVNHWLHHGAPKNDPAIRMVRTLDGRARAFLGRDYRVIDNFDVVSAAILPVLKAHGDRKDIQCKSAQVTERRMYLQIVNEKVEGEVEVGDVVQAGVCVRNSEVGSGALAIEPMLWRLVCKNGMVSADNMLRKYHVGGGGQRGRNGNGLDDALEDDMIEMLSEDTITATNEALMMQVQDVFDAALRGPVFEKQIEKCRRAAADIVDVPILPFAEVTAKHFRLNEREAEAVTLDFARAERPSRWAIANAITAAAKSQDPDRAYEMERFGNRMVELPRNEWDDLKRRADRLAADKERRDAKEAEGGGTPSRRRRSSSSSRNRRSRAAVNA